MMGGVNGANVNLYSGFQNIREQSTSHIKSSTDENFLNLSSRNLAKNASSNSDQIKFHKDDEPLKFAKDNSLTGIAANGKISIWGKLMGYDKQISQDEINELKRFDNQTEPLGFGRL